MTIVAVQEFGPYQPFQLLDLPAERGLRHVELRGGSAEVKVLCDSDEAPQLIQSEHWHAPMRSGNQWMLSLTWTVMCVPPYCHEHVKFQ
jgi:hypothetical protein